MRETWKVVGAVEFEGLTETPALGFVVSCRVAPLEWGPGMAQHPSGSESWSLSMRTTLRLDFGNNWSQTTTSQGVPQSLKSSLGERHSPRPCMFSTPMKTL